MGMGSLNWRLRAGGGGSCKLLFVGLAVDMVWYDILAPASLSL